VFLSLTDFFASIAEVKTLLKDVVIKGWKVYEERTLTKNDFELFIETGRMLYKYLNQKLFAGFDIEAKSLGTPSKSPRKTRTFGTNTGGRSHNGPVITQNDMHEMKEIKDELKRVFKLLCSKLPTFVHLREGANPADKFINELKNKINLQKPDLEPTVALSEEKKSKKEGSKKSDEKKDEKNDGSKKEEKKGSKKEDKKDEKKDEKKEDDKKENDKIEDDKKEDDKNEDDKKEEEKK
uniref:Uncharacterized protein n=1 Tax=Panagrolaimus sp. JU765 TaxID=591449 RepID=A0AC34R1Z1_9BILA